MLLVAVGALTAIVGLVVGAIVGVIYGARFKERILEREGRLIPRTPPAVASKSDE